MKTPAHPYRIQRGTLAGPYRTVATRVSERSAWMAYFKTVIQAGEKKRIQEKIPGGDWRNKTKPERVYWT